MSAPEIVTRVLLRVAKPNAAKNAPSDFPYLYIIDEAGQRCPDVAATVAAAYKHLPFPPYVLGVDRVWRNPESESTWLIVDHKGKLVSCAEMLPMRTRGYTSTGRSPIAPLPPSEKHSPLSRKHGIGSRLVGRTK